MTFPRSARESTVARSTVNILLALESESRFGPRKLEGSYVIGVNERRLAAASPRDTLLCPVPDRESTVSFTRRPDKADEESPDELMTDLRIKRRCAIVKT